MFAGRLLDVCSMFARSCEQDIIFRVGKLLSLPRAEAVSVHNRPSIRISSLLD